MTVLLMGAAIVLLILAAVLIGSALRVASRPIHRAPSGVSVDTGSSWPATAVSSSSAEENRDGGDDHHGHHHPGTSHDSGGTWDGGQDSGGGDSGDSSGSSDT